MNTYLGHFLHCGAAAAVDATVNWTSLVRPKFVLVEVCKVQQNLIFQASTASIASQSACILQLRNSSFKFIFAPQQICKVGGTCTEAFRVSSLFSQLHCPAECSTCSTSHSLPAR